MDTAQQKISENVALEFLYGLYIFLEADYDCTFGENSLTINLKNGDFYNIHYHESLNEIWMTSPESGVHHFVFIEGKWICTKTDEALDAILVKELVK